ncbi:MFS transporter, FHS family, L-fucose permease [Parapedobacter composti]|uniref:MFS transporter, FHS family, L-fucose permease n=1 Tax=Parapedobacter composti TaxID=623281 RepID=A0A1I1JG24_9SPHI|nr:L-fucose:H+ symporter permease [Parapedobacter composti]SFC47487.1 MFS transporter, FHS family, L-fucose permease [Parapedobacter composti]
MAKRYSMIPVVLVTSLFFLWGLANNMTDTLLAAFKKIMSMTDAQTSLIQMSFYGAYFVLALPAALYIRRYSYKSGILLGVGLFTAGALLFYPASRTMDYAHFLIALFVLAGGLSILETAANPYILSLGPAQTATRRLNIAQSFNPIGSITGVVLSKFIILSALNRAGHEERAGMDSAALKQIQSVELGAVMQAYVGLAIVLAAVWLLIRLVKMPTDTDTDKRDIGQAFSKLFRNRNYVTGVIAQFFYVGAQIGVWSFTIRYVMQELQLDEGGASDYYIASLVVFMVCRFIAAGLMRYVRPARLLTVLSVLAILLALIVALGGGHAGVYALIAISGCMSLMFPTIYGLACDGLGSDRKIGGAGLIMAILGGAVLTYVQGLLSDATNSINLSYLVPLCCFAVVAVYGFSRWRAVQI